MTLFQCQNNVSEKDDPISMSKQRQLIKSTWKFNVEATFILG